MSTLSLMIHELVRLLELTRNERFVPTFTEHYPTWRETRAELNEVSSPAEIWRDH